ncbi:MAG: hypothetical protein WC959_08860 [Kiritimatiellales bacterium]
MMHKVMLMTAFLLTAQADDPNDVYVTRFSVTGPGTAVFRLEGDHASRVHIVRAEPVKEGAPALMWRCNGEGLFQIAFPENTPDGFFRLKPESGDTVLGMVHRRNNGRSIQFTSEREKNTAYPPEIAGWSEEEKSRQTAAARTMVADLNRRIQSGEKTIVVPADNYRFKGFMDNGKDALLFDGLEGVSIDFSGSTFWVAGVKQRILTITGCSDFTISNYTVDYDPLPWVQGRVISVGEGAYPPVRFELDQGFEEALAQFQATPPNGYARIHVFKPEPGHPYSATFVAGHDRGQPAVYDETTRTVTVSLQGRDTGLPWFGIVEGDGIVLAPRYNGNYMMLTKSSNVTFDRVNIYASARLGWIGEYDGEKPYRLQNVRLIRRPNTARLISSCLDGFRVNFCKHGLQISDFELEGVMDDAVALPSHNSIVLKSSSSTTMTAAARDLASSFNVDAGSTIDVYDSRTFVYRGSATVLSAEKLSDQEETVPAEHPTRLYKGKKTTPWKLVLDRPLAVERGDTIISDRWRSDGYRIERGYFHVNFACAIRATAKNGMIRGNVFEQSGGIRMEMDNDWIINTPMENIGIENNAFYGIQRDPSITVSVLPHSISNPLHRQVSIRNNVFYNTIHPVIYATHTDGLQIQANRFTGISGDSAAFFLPPPLPGEQGAPLSAAVIQLERNGSVTLENNDFNDIAEGVEFIAEGSAP